jgi:hypothetical protein
VGARDRWRPLRRVALALAAVGAGPAAAQAGSEFDYILLAAGGAGPLGSAWDGAWEASPAASFHAATPYHHGLVGIAVRAWRNDRAAEDLPDFTAFHAMGGWGPAVGMPGGARIMAAAHVGALAFRFDDEDDFSGALRNETELTFGLAARTDIGVHGPLRAWAGADVVRVFTRPGETLYFVEAGLSVALTAPGWFRGALRR